MVSILLILLALADLRTEVLLLSDQFTITGLGYAIRHHQLAVVVLLVPLSLASFRLALGAVAEFRQIESQVRCFTSAFTGPGCGGGPPRFEQIVGFLLQQIGSRFSQPTASRPASVPRNGRN